MHIGFLNPQGNFDPGGSYLTTHPDFGGQLVYVKLVAIAMADRGHKIDILTRQIIDPDWPEFASPFDAYPDVPNVRIIRLPAGPKGFLRKELLWPHLVQDWVPNILQFYQKNGGLPDAMTAHYGDGGLCGVLISQKAGVPFTFTAHSLGVQKMDKLEVTRENQAQMQEQFHFSYRLMAERLSMNYSAVNITSTRQERFEQYSHRAYRGAVDVEDDRRFAVIPPGGNMAIFGADARSPDEEAIQELVVQLLARDIAENRRDLPAIVAASRLDPKKNIVGLVQAFAQSQTLQERANLVFIGGSLEDPLHDDSGADDVEREVLASIREVVEANDLWGKISAFHLPGQPGLAVAYRFLALRGSVFALTALYEPFGLAPLEAAAAGLPVVVTRNGGPSESMREGDEEFGVLVDPSDTADIARGLERVLCDRDAWEYFAHSGQQRVYNRYTWKLTAQGYLDQLEKILASPERAIAERLPIPPYFLDFKPENDTSVDDLMRLYFVS